MSAVKRDHLTRLNEMGLINAVQLATYEDKLEEAEIEELYGKTGHNHRPEFDG